jgi:uncharacterized protein (DUF983 family)
MKRTPRTIVLVLWRALKLRCPVCGLSSILRAPFQIKAQCGVCDSIFKREEGFFVGAIMANVVATEVVILLVYLACLWLTQLGEQTIITVLLIVALGFPLAFYHHSWALWLAMDQLIEGLPKTATKSI